MITGVGVVVLTAAAAAIAFRALRQEPPRRDPAYFHTPEGMVATIRDQQPLLEQALARGDLEYIHGQMYYLQGMADALSSKLEGEQKQRVDALLAELKRAAEELDNFTGRANHEATAASLPKLYDCFAALERELLTHAP
jgi:hypothetical protein